jgi:hypothetical protein
LSKTNPYAAKTKKDVTEVQVETPPVSYDVPTGSIATILNWVDGDADKAHAAFEVETEEKGRVSLLSQLKDLF